MDKEIDSQSALMSLFYELRGEAKSLLSQSISSGEIDGDLLTAWYATETKALGSPSVLASIIDRFASESALTYMVRAISKRHETTNEVTYFSHGRGISLPELAIYDWFEPKTVPVRDSSMLDRQELTPEFVNWLAALHDQAQVEEEKKLLGRYYTPEPIAEYLLNSANFTSRQPLETLRIIDPACGGGIFLAVAARKLVTQMTDRNFDSIVHLLRETLYGVDVQPFAVVLTKLHILASVLETLGNDPDRAIGDYIFSFPNIKVGDILRNPEDLTGEPFNAIVGNPPYGNNCSGIDLSMHEGVVNGRPNLYTLFLNWAMKRCKPGGRIAFVLPASFKSGLFYRDLRKELQKQTIPLSFAIFQARAGVVEDVEQDLLAAVLQKREIIAPKTKTQAKIIHCRDGESLTQALPSLVDAENIILEEAFGYCFCIGRSAADYQVVRRIIQGATTLRALGIQAGTGSFVWNEHKEELLDRSCENAAPILYANSVHPYALVFPPESNNPGRTSCYARLTPKTKKLLSSEDLILIKRTTNRDQLRRIVAAPCLGSFKKEHQSYFIENHVNFLVATENAKIDLFYLTALLNSKLINFFFGLVNGNTHVSVTELRFMPVRADSSGTLNKLLEKRMRLANPKRIVEIDQALDDAVFSIYELPASERKVVESWFEEGNGRKKV